MRRFINNRSHDIRPLAAAAALIASIFLASCTSTGSSYDVGASGFAPNSSTEADEPVTDDSGVEIAALLPASGIAPASKPAGYQSTAEPVAAITASPSAANGATAVVSADQPPAATQAPDAAAAAEFAIASAASQNNAAPIESLAASETKQALSTEETGTVQASATPSADAADTGTTISLAPESSPETKKPKTLFAALFGGPAAKKPKPVQVAAVAEEPQLAIAETSSEDAAGQVVLANLDQPLKATVFSAEPPANNGALPGVRQNALFEITRRDNANHDNDIDISEEDAAPIQVAYAAGLARLTPNGLRVQRESVDVACLRPQLVKVLKGVERHYGRQLVVTSGFRSPSFNRRVRGAKHSLHMYCAAADIQVPGVSKWSLAQYLRSMPGRGGVGTYCSTDSVHIDIGPNRDWNWRCSRRKKRG